MSKWSDMINEGFLNGTKLSKEVIETKANSKKIIEALNSLRKVSDNLNAFKNALIEVGAKYEKATCETIDIELLRELNSEAKARNRFIDSSFEMTLNWLSVKKEWETEEVMEKRLAWVFKLPVVK